jgi:hydrogen peroxide-dependent heme synthase
MAEPVVKLNRGIHVLHLFYQLDRAEWGALGREKSGETRSRLEQLLAANNAASHPRITSYVNVGGKADLVFMLTAAELAQLSRMHRQIEQCFAPGAIEPVYTFLSVTELPEYVTTEEDMLRRLSHEFKLEPGTDAYNAKLAELKGMQAQYEQYRLYPELPDWEVMAFYPMSKRRSGEDNWYMLDFEARKKLMAGHARVGRKFGGRISQLITGATGLDDWEWGVTLMAHQIDALKEIVYEMRFDEVSARYGEFGPFYINLRLGPADIWDHLGL